MTIVEMCVHMDCSGCESKIRKALLKLEGVDDIDIDMAMQKVTVTGYVEQKKVLKAVRKTGRRAVLWPYPYDTETIVSQHYYHQNVPAQSLNYPVTYTRNPFAYSTGSMSSYNYLIHGYDESVVMNGYYEMPASSRLLDEKASSMFSDENPHACSIM